MDLAQVKSYLSINSDTHDGTLANIINYATGVVEHYIGQQVWLMIMLKFLMEENQVYL